METEFITFKKFNDPALAGALTQLLDKKHIAYQTIQGPTSLTPYFVDNTASTIEYDVKIAPEDFTRVNKLLVDSELEDINNIDKSYYLFDFTDDELTDILSKPDEWNSFDQQLARKLLTERGH